MLVAITGTPGTGKSATCAVLESRGYVVIELDEVARREGFVVARDEVRGTDEVDVEALRDHLQIPVKIAFLKAHYSHWMNVNLVVVLRCRPSSLRSRLEARGWPSEKIRENVEAEAIDVITQEAVTRIAFVYEIDTTSRTPAQTADTVLEILQGKTKGHEPGSFDWSEEVLSWY